MESLELDPNVANAVVRFAEVNNRTLIAFCGARILCKERNSDTDRVLEYGEPVPVWTSDKAQPDVACRVIDTRFDPHFFC